MQIPESTGWAAAIISLLSLVGVIYTARQGRTAAARDDFREDFQALATDLRRDRDELRVDVARLREVVTEQDIDIRALARRVRVLGDELERHGLPLPPIPPPPPDLSKHLV